MTALGTAGSHGSDRRDDQMSHQDEPIPHTANDDRAGRKLQDYEPVANCVRISIRHGHVRQGANIKAICVIRHATSSVSQLVGKVLRRQYARGGLLVWTERRQAERASTGSAGVVSDSAPGASGNSPVANFDRIQEY